MKPNTIYRFLLLLALHTSASSLAVTEQGADFWQTRLDAALHRVNAATATLIQLYRELEDTEGRIIDIANVNEGRLTVQSATPVTTTSLTNQSTIYFTPYAGSCISLYNGTYWTIYRFTERSLALSGLTSGKNYDVFIYNNAGTLTLELSAAWASDTARTDAISTQDGILVKTSATSRRYLGTIRATAATQTQDSLTQRFVWNYQNQVYRHLFVSDGANSWTYATDSWRSTDNSTANRVEYVVGSSDVLVNGKAMLLTTLTTGAFSYYATGFGIDSTTVDSSNTRGGSSYISTATGTMAQTWSEMRKHSSLGYHYIQWLERGNTSTCTFYGDNGNANAYQSGMLIDIRG